jgi:HEAT repeat protein
MVAAFNKLPSPAQVLMLDILADRADKHARTGVAVALSSDDPDIRLGAIRAVGRYGDSHDALYLLGIVRTASRELSVAIVESLASLPGQGVDATILKAIDTRDTATRVAAIDALGRRAYVASIPALLNRARSTQPQIRIAAMRALGELAGEKELGAMVRLLSLRKDPAELETAEAAFAAIYSRVSNRDTWTTPLIAALDTAPAPSRIVMFRLLARGGGQKALAAIRRAVDDAGADVRDAAVRLLADWPTAEPAEDLLAIATRSTVRTHQILTLRGYLRMASLTEVAQDRRLEMCRIGLRTAQRDDDRRLAIASLSSIASPRALEIVLPYLDNLGLKEEAGSALVKIGQALLPNNAREVASAMEQVLQSKPSSELSRQASELKAKAKQPVSQ